MGWELIGGDPAPGSPDAVAAAARALGTVADLAAQGRQELIAQSQASGMQHWTGTAAAAFHADVGTLPTLLDQLAGSYRDAASALTTWSRALYQAQADARAALGAARTAQADHDAAAARQRSAEHERDSLSAQHAAASLRLAGLRTQQNLALDPAHRASLTAPIASARTQVDRLDADLGQARQSVSRYQGQAEEAQGRLDAARARAQQIRDRLDAVAGATASALASAEKEGHLPSWLEQHYQEAKQDLVTYGPEVVDALQKAQFVLSLAAAVPTPLSPFLEGASLACGGIALVLSVGIDAAQPGGITGGNLLDLGVQALSLAAGGASMKGWSTASRVLGDASDAGGIVESTEEHGGGWRGFAFAAGTYVVGKGASAGVVKGAQFTAARANADPAVQQQLTGMSRRLRAQSEHPTGTREISLDPDETRTVQTILGSGRIPPGGALPGNHMADPAGGGPLDHAQSGTAVLHGGEDLVDEPVSDIVEKVGDWAAGQIPALHPRDDRPEIEIDLNPSPYGSAR